MLRAIIRGSGTRLRLRIRKRVSSRSRKGASRTRAAIRGSLLAAFRAIAAPIDRPHAATTAAGPPSLPQAASVSIQAATSPASRVPNEPRSPPLRPCARVSSAATSQPCRFRASIRTRSAAGSSAKPWSRSTVPFAARPAPAASGGAYSPRDPGVGPVPEPGELDLVSRDRFDRLAEPPLRRRRVDPERQVLRQRPGLPPRQNDHPGRRLHHHHDRAGQGPEHERRHRDGHRQQRQASPFMDPMRDDEHSRARILGGSRPPRRRGILGPGRLRGPTGTSTPRASRCGGRAGRGFR